MRSLLRAKVAAFLSRLGVQNYHSIARIILLAANLAACSKKLPSPNAIPTAEEQAIVGGREADGAEAFLRSVVAIGDETTEWCTGSIYSDSIVITAAHCVDPEREHPDAKDMRIYFGDDVRDLAKATSRKVLAFKILDGWSKGSFQCGSDLAVVIFEGGLPQGYEPIELLADKAAVKSGAKVAAAGYGLSSYDFDNSYGLLRYYTAEFKPSFRWTIAAVMSFAQDEPAGSIYVTERLDGKSFYKGDSGGPHFIRHEGRWKQYALSSGAVPPVGSSDAENGFFVMTDLVDRRAFIEESAKQLLEEITKP